MKSAQLCSIESNEPYSVPQLVRVCVHSFDQNGHCNNETFVIAFLSVHSWMLESVELLGEFLSLYEEFCNELPSRIQLCHAVAFWIKTCPSHFDTSVCSLVHCLRRMAIRDGIREAAHLLDLSSLPSFPWLRNISVKGPVERQVSLSFEQWGAEDLAMALSQIDYKALFRIPIAELKTYCKDGNLSRTPLLQRSISIFNSLSSWVQYMILSKTTVQARADIITKFVNVGKHLRKISNYNTLMAVIGGVTHSNIARLSKTAACIPNDIKNDLTSLTQLLSNQSNFANYRRELNALTDSFKIPIMGVHLKDLIAMYVKDKEQLCSKIPAMSLQYILCLYRLLSYFVCLDRSPSNFPNTSVHLINTLKVSLDITYNEDDIYDLSLKREPRTLLNLQGATKSVVFADWASGVSCAPDPDTVTKHVSAMVDVVFKHYDRDRDGCISQSEFEVIAGNFPFIAPFGDIDRNQDGQITKAEMKNFFVQVNKQLVELRREFKHNFHETTFLTPTLCTHCGKILWGLIRQGYKCKDCGRAVHSYCKDIVVAECRKRNGNNPFLASAASTSRPENKTLLSVRMDQRLRTVSTVSDGTSNSNNVNSAPSTSSANAKTSAQLRTLSTKLRARSETVDCYRPYSPDSPNGRPLPSLACEEVFDDETLTVAPSEAPISLERLPSS